MDAQRAHRFFPSSSFPERFPKAPKVWSEAETRAFALQIADLLEYLHSKNIYGSKLELKVCARFRIFFFFLITIEGTLRTNALVFSQKNAISTARH